MGGKSIGPNETRPAEFARAIRELFWGRSHGIGTVTLRANETTTVVTHPNCGLDSVVSLSPKTAHAATALATTYILASNVTVGQFTITHANTADVDKTFAFALRG